MRITLVERQLLGRSQPPILAGLRGRGHDIRFGDQDEVELDGDVVVVLQNALWHRRA